MLVLLYLVHFVAIVGVGSIGDCKNALLFRNSMNFFGASGCDGVTVE